MDELLKESTFFKETFLLGKRQFIFVTFLGEKVVNLCVGIVFLSEYSYELCVWIVVVRVGGNISFQAGDLNTGNTVSKTSSNVDEKVGFFYKQSPENWRQKSRKTHTFSLKVRKGKGESDVSAKRCFLHLPLEKRDAI